MAGTIETGAQGERAAVEYLRRQGYNIMDTNWRSGHYEIDIVAEKGDIVHFVEVKCRRAGSLTSPEEALTDKKAGFVLRATNSYISLHGIERECSVDLIAVDAQADGTFTVRHIPGAVQPRW